MLGDDAVEKVGPGPGDPADLVRGFLRPGEIV